MSRRAVNLALLTCGLWTWTGPQSRGAQEATLLITEGSYPRAFFFRSSESQAANTHISYAERSRSPRRHRGGNIESGLHPDHFRSMIPASMYCPPVVWRQWTAMTFWPGFSAARASGRIANSS